VGRLDRNGPRLADDVQIRGDQTAFVDDEAGSQALLPAFASGKGDDDDRRTHFGGEGFDVERCRLVRCGGQGGRDDDRSQDQISANHVTTVLTLFWLCRLWFLAAAAFGLDPAPTRPVRKSA